MSIVLRDCHLFWNSPLCANAEYGGATHWDGPIAAGTEWLSGETTGPLKAEVPTLECQTAMFIVLMLIRDYWAYSIDRVD